MRQVIRIALLYLITIALIGGSQHEYTPSELEDLSERSLSMYMVTKDHMHGPKSVNGTYLNVVKFFMPFMEEGLLMGEVYEMFGAPTKHKLVYYETKADSIWADSWTYTWLVDDEFTAFKLLFTKDPEADEWYLHTWMLFQ
jgi:hypothetical protein